MAIVDPNIPNGPKMPSLGWNNGGTAAATPPMKRCSSPTKMGARGHDLTTGRIT